MIDSLIDRLIFPTTAIALHHLMIGSLIDRLFVPMAPMVAMLCLKLMGLS